MVLNYLDELKLSVFYNLCFLFFNSESVRIISIMDDVEVLKSKEKPKKVTMLGDDGHAYSFLCKREDRGGMCTRVITNIIASVMLTFSQHVFSVIFQNPKDVNGFFKTILRIFITSDMRKNSRMMEFCTVINRLFLNGSESRRRPALRLCTYAVLPMTEDSGVIEWVRETTTIRSILFKLYASKSMRKYLCALVLFFKYHK